MSGVRVLVGTRKGPSCSARTAPAKTGTSVVLLRRMGGLPREGLPSGSNRIYASQSTSWFGQLIQRSDDGGLSWNPVVTSSFMTEYRNPPVYDGTPHPWEFARVWHLEPSLSDPDTVLAALRTPPLSLRRRRNELE